MIEISKIDRPLSPVPEVEEAYVPVPIRVVARGYFECLPNEYPSGSLTSRINRAVHLKRLAINFSTYDVSLTLMAEMLNRTLYKSSDLLYPIWEEKELQLSDVEDILEPNN